MFVSIIKHNLENSKEEGKSTVFSCIFPYHIIIFFFLDIQSVFSFIISFLFKEFSLDFFDQGCKSAGDKFS